MNKLLNTLDDAQHVVYRFVWRYTGWSMPHWMWLCRRIERQMVVEFLRKSDESHVS